jgi:EpsI family protein
MNRANSKYVILVMPFLFYLYGQLFYTLINEYWSRNDQAYGSILLLLSLFLLYKKFLSENETFSLSWIVPSVLGFMSLFFLVVGKAYGIIQIYYISFPLLVCSFLAIKNQYFIYKYWFCLLLMCLSLPLPLSITDIISHPMKLAVSVVSEIVLSILDYPIARNGVIIQVGNYNILVADACSGLKSFFTLEVFGIAYLTIVKSDSLFRNITLGVLIFPISFFCNTLRVIILILLTYHFGESVGQGFLHQFSGLILFILALLMTLFFDSILNKIDGKNKKIDSSSQSTLSVVLAKFNTIELRYLKAYSVFIIIGVIVSSLADEHLKPSVVMNYAIKILDAIPERVEEYNLSHDNVKYVDIYTQDSERSFYYDKVLNRNYVSSNNVKSLTVAYSNKQVQDVKVHRQEVCYHAQGFNIASEIIKDEIEIFNKNISVYSFLVEKDQNLDVISYYIRIGDSFFLDAKNTRLYILKEAVLNKSIPDGLLVRVSTSLRTKEEFNSVKKTNIKFIENVIKSSKNINFFIRANKQK